MPVQAPVEGLEDGQPVQPPASHLLYLAADLRFAVAAVCERFNTCRLVSVRDLNDELPARSLSRIEVERVLQNLADHGIRVIEEDAADRLAP